MDVKLLRNNLLMLLGYAVLAQLLALMERNGGAMVVLLLMMVGVSVHVAVLVLGALITLAGGNKVKAGQWLLNALLVGVIGLGTCWGGASMADLYSGPMNLW